MAETTLRAVEDVVRQTLGLGPQRKLGADTPLFGVMPEFDSLAVVELALALERQFGLTIDDEDFTGDLFATVGSLAAYVEVRLHAGEMTPAD